MSLDGIWPYHNPKGFHDDYGKKTFFFNYILFQHFLKVIYSFLDSYLIAPNNQRELPSKGYWDPAEYWDFWKSTDDCLQNLL